MNLTKDDIAAVKEALKPEFDQLNEQITGVKTTLRQEIKAVREEIKATEQRLNGKIEKEIKGQDKLFETILTNIIRYELGKQKEELKNELRPTIEKVERHEKAFELLTTAVAAE